jgi:flagellar basal body-associated protein FliL
LKKIKIILIIVVSIIAIIAIAGIIKFNILQDDIYIQNSDGTVSKYNSN